MCQSSPTVALAPFGAPPHVPVPSSSPRSSLLAMVEAFAGPVWRELYRLGAEQGYRFLSFGDAMLLDPATAGADPATTRGADT